MTTGTKMPNIDRQAHLMLKQGFLPTNKIAEALGVDIVTIRRLANKVYHEKIGAIYYFRISDIIDYYGQHSPGSRDRTATLINDVISHMETDQQTYIVVAQNVPQVQPVSQPQQPQLPAHTALDGTKKRRY
jgi:hypothetical protein